MTDEQNSVTPEWLETMSYDVGHRNAFGYPTNDSCGKYCPGCAFDKAAQALRAEREKREQEELGRLDAEGALWRIVPNTHSVPQQDPFEGPGETYHDAYNRLAEENRRQAQEIERLRAEVDDSREVIMDLVGHWKNDTLRNLNAVMLKAEYWVKNARNSALSATDTAKQVREKPQ